MRTDASSRNGILNTYSMKNSSIKVNKVNIRFLSPVILVFYSVLIFFACLPLLPVEIQYPMSFDAILFWLLCFVGFLVGVRTGAGRDFSMPIQEHRFDPKKLHSMVSVIVWVGALGVLLLIVDRYFIRGVSLDADVFQNREALEGSQASAFSAIAAFASSLGLFSLITIWIAETNIPVVNKWLKILASLNVFIAVYLSIQLGSRSLLLVVALAHLLAWLFILRARGLRLAFRHKIIAILSIAGLAIISTLMMLSRVDLMGFSMQESVLNSAYSYTMVPSFEVRESFDDNIGIGEVAAGFFSLVQYIFHGIFEFGLLFTYFQGEHEWGARTLWLPLKLIAIFTGGIASGEQAINVGERYGVYTTFLGPVFIDFGLLSPLVLIFYGWLLGVPFRALRLGKIEWIPAVVLIAASSILWPVVNILSSASGSYLLVCSLLIGIAGNKIRAS